MKIIRIMKRTLSVFLSLSITLSMAAAVSGETREPEYSPEEAVETSLTALAEESEEEYIDRMIESMPLKLKIEQMLIPAFRFWTDEEGEDQPLTQLNDPVKEVLSAHNFGGVILFAENTQGTEQTVRFVTDVGAANASALSSNTVPIPMFFAIDQEGGRIGRLQTGTLTCGNMALGALNSTDEVKVNAGIIGSELSALGINVDFAPVMDVNSNPANPIIGVRSFSSDPERAARLGACFTQALQEQGVMTSLKHFPGHGDTDTDSHTGLPSIDKSLEELRKCELIPFKAGIEAGTDMIMTAHIVFPQIEKQTYTSISTGEEIYVPATLSKTIIQGVLREELGFEGLVVTDALEMDAIREHFRPEDSLAMAVNAGVDLMLIPFETKTQEALDDISNYLDMAEGLVESGTVSEEKIDEALRRILKCKWEKGIIEKGSAAPDLNEALQLVGSQSNHDREWEVTVSSMTLLKNENNTLPIDPAAGEKLLILTSRSSESNSVEYALNRLKEEGKLSEDAQIEVDCYQDKKVEDFSSQLEGVDKVLAISRMTGISWLDTENEENGASALFLEALIRKMHEKGGKAAIISDLLPYDAAKLTEADAFLLAYNDKIMSEIPVQGSAETKTYGPNLPAAVYTALGGGEPAGKLPVDIPKLKEDGSFDDEILYPLDTGLNYDESAEDGGKKIELGGKSYTISYDRSSLVYTGKNLKKQLLSLLKLKGEDGNAVEIASISAKSLKNVSGNGVITMIKLNGKGEKKQKLSEPFPVEISPYTINSENLVDYSKKEKWVKIKNALGKMKKLKAKKSADSAKGDYFYDSETNTLTFAGNYSGTVQLTENGK